MTPRATAVTVGTLGQTEPPAAKAIERARAAETDGFSTAWWPCHLMGWTPDAVWNVEYTPLAQHVPSPHVFFEPFTMMGAVGAATENLRVGVSVTDTFRRPPGMLAQVALTVDHLSQGRTIVGLGSGERLNISPYGMEWDKPVGRLEEAIRVIRLLWASEGPVNFDGRFFQLRDAVLGLQPYGDRPPPVWLAAHGPRMLDICGRLADGWLPTSITPEAYADKLGVIRRSAEAAGRDPQAITPSMAAMVLCAPDDGAVDELCADPIVRLQFAAVDLGAETYAKHGTTPPFATRTGFHSFLPTTVTRAEADRIVEHITPGMVRDQTLCGTPEQIAEQILVFAQAGLRDILVLNLTPFASMEHAAYSFRGMRRLPSLVAG